QIVNSHRALLIPQFRLRPVVRETILGFSVRFATINGSISRQPEVITMKRVTLAFCLSLLSFTLFSFGYKFDSTVAAKETWTGVSSKHFYLTSNATEKDIRKVATNLEQFREVFSRLFPRANINSPVPIKVIVFKDRKSYQPFMPAYQGKVNEVAG